MTDLLTTLPEPTSIRDLLLGWPISDLALSLRVHPDRIYKWAQVGRIPAEFHHEIVVLGALRGKAVSHSWLALQHATARIAS